MSFQIKQFFTVSTVADEQTRSADLLNSIILVSAGIILAVLVVQALVTGFNWLNLTASSLALMILIVTRVFLYRGYTRLASLLFLGSLWILITWVVVVTGGLTAESYGIFVVLLFAIGLLLGQRILFVFTGIAVLTSLGLLFIELTGWYAFAPLVEGSPWDHWITQTATIAIATGLVFYATRSIDQALHRSQRDAEVLRQSEERLRLVLQNMPVMMDALDENGTFAVWNRECEKVTGYSAGEIIGAPKAFDKLYPDAAYREAMLTEWSRRGNDFRNWEWKITAKDGVIKTVAWSNISARFPIPEWKTWGIGVDVTERRQAEAAFEERLRFESLLVKTSSQLINLQPSEIDEAINQALDRFGKFIAVDRCFVVRFSSDQTRMSSTNEWVAAEVKAKKQSFQNVSIQTLPWLIEKLRRGETVVINQIVELPPEARLERQYMQAENLQSIIVVPMIVSSTILGFIGFNVDRQIRQWSAELSQSLRLIGEIFANTIERGRVQEALRRSEERWRTYFQQANDLIFSLDASGKITSINDAACHTLGYSAQELIGGNPLDFITPESLDVATEAATALLNGVDIDRLEVGVVTKNGQHITLEIRGRIIYENDKVEGTFHIARDVTERKKDEETLRQAQKLESLGVMSGGIAHDFNNLLTAILGQSSLIQRKLPSNNPLKHNVDSIVQAAEQAAHLTQQLLAYSGRGQFEVRLINLNQVIQENLHLFKVAIPKNVHIQANLSTSLALIRADIGQIQQLVMNLIINAAEAMETRPGIVEVTTKVQHLETNASALKIYTGQALSPGRYVTLTVKDDGVGMDEITLSKIFDPFFTTKSTGRGLGLAAVSGIVRGHNGGLQVESAVEQGTIFRLFFPAVSQKIEAVDPDRVTDSSDLTGTVLVIDDEASVRDLVIDILDSEGVQGIAAANGAEGKLLFQEHLAEIRLVLLDLSMPGLSGEETCQALKDIKPGVPIVLSSGYRDVELSSSLQNLGVVDFLQKPYRWDQLLSLVRRYLT